MNAHLDPSRLLQLPEQPFTLGWCEEPSHQMNGLQPPPPRESETLPLPLHVRHLEQRALHGRLAWLAHAARRTHGAHHGPQLFSVFFSLSVGT